MEIVEDRHGRGSTLITSQLPLDKWHDIIGEPTFADAILDRIVHNSYRLELEGPSMRKLKANEQMHSTTAAAAIDSGPRAGAPLSKSAKGSSR
jgi:DNA replication protein DnaC